MPTDLRVDAARVLAFMDIYGLTMVDVARETHYDRSYISKVLARKLQPSTAFLAELASALDRLGKARRLDSSFLLETNRGKERAGA